MEIGFRGRKDYMVGLYRSTPTERLSNEEENGASPGSHNRKQLVRPFQFIILTSSYSPTSSYSFISQV